MVKRARGSLLLSIKFDRNSHQPISTQLYVAMRELILAGGFLAGERLPATRTLAKDLGISRTTVIEVFDRLTSESLVTSKTGAGTYVSKALSAERPKHVTSQTKIQNQRDPQLSRLMGLDVQALQRSHTQSPYRQIAGSVLQRARIAPTRLLVVDDAWTVRMTMKQLLEDAGYQVDTAHNGNAALERLRQALRDLVLTDLEMPEMNGLELARRMRDLPAWREIPLVMITSRSATKHQEAAHAAGVQLYLTKPYRDADLLAHIGQMLAAAPKRAQPPLASAPTAALLSA